MPSNERECTECGRTFRGMHRRCTRCRTTDRVCACGQSYRGEHRMCPSCRPPRPMRTCECGRDITGGGFRCSRCRTTERTCACGRTFRGLSAKCQTCRKTTKTCECGRVFRGYTSKCRSCRARTVACQACGKTFRGDGTRCSSCRAAAQPKSDRQETLHDAYLTRRAQKRDAQVDGPLSKRDYRDIWQGERCVYCGAASQCVDHVRPLSRGGLEHRDNLVPACVSCNSSKRDLLLTEWSTERVRHAVACSTKAAAEFDRLSVP